MKEKKREIPVKNYIYVSLIFIGLFFATIYCAKWYRTVNTYYETTSVMKEVLSEMKIDSLPSYLLDNPEVVIYISSSTDKTIKSFEKKFKKFVSHNGINNYILYLDMEQEENVEIDSFLMNNYLSQSLNRIKSIKTPNLLYFKDGEIEDLLYIRESEISIKDVEQFLKRNGVIEND